MPANPAIATITTMQQDLGASFPIESQTSDSDKAFLLCAMDVMRFRAAYAYVEVGSYLGGSLTPFLMDPRCERVLSIDERERQQADERGARYDYAGVTHASMIAGLKAHGMSTDKLQTFDGSIDTMPRPADTFDLAFIDGEHTDVSCFRDFLWLQPLMATDAIIMFHDSTLVFKALQQVQLLLRRSGTPFTFLKKAGSEMSALFLGDLRRPDIIARFGEAEDLASFYSHAEKTVLYHQIKNRVVFDTHFHIHPTRVVPVVERHDPST